MQLPRCRNALILKDILMPSLSKIIPTASFHSTPISGDKRKSKFHSDARESQQPSKNRIKFVTRHKRADTKKALNNLFNCGRCESPFQHQQRIRTFGLDDLNAHVRKKKVKSCSQHPPKCKTRNPKSKFRTDSFEASDYTEKVFEATFGNKQYTWSFNESSSSSRGSTFRFQNREQKNWTKYSSKEWDSVSESESEEESCSVGSPSDRAILGLPSTGPLKVEDVKKAFHSSALKWHPDLHQGPLQILVVPWEFDNTDPATAGEKFKVCLDAYKSLCAALS